MMLSLKNVSKTYTSEGNQIHALDRVDFSIQPGEISTIRGPSGSGKSTFLLTSGGLLQPDGGSVELDDLNLYDLNPSQSAEIRRKKIGFIFQQFHLVPYLSVLENVLAPALPGRTPKDAESLLERFSLSHRLHHSPAKLSVGEKQRTALARALINDPRLILADEPTGNLDPENTKIVLDAFEELAKDNKSITIVTHAPEVAQITRSQLVLDQGKLQPPESSLN